MKIVFTHHALAKLRERGIVQRLVRQALRSPDFIMPGYANRERAYKRFGRNYLEVIFVRKGDVYVVITQHWVAKAKPLR